MLREFHRIALSGKTMFDSTAGRYFLVAKAQNVKQKSMGGAFVALCTVDTIRDDYTQFNVLEVVRDDGGTAWKTLKSPSTRLNGPWVAQHIEGCYCWRNINGGLRTDFV